MTADAYLNGILARESVDTGLASPVRAVQATLEPILRGWAGVQLNSISPSGSFAKGTANKSGTDIDLFISLSHNVTNTLKEIYESLFTTMQKNGYAPRRQNVSINVTVNGYDVDLVPAKRQDTNSQDHSLYRRRADTWTKTNVTTHVAHVRTVGLLNETRILKLWRTQKQLDLPSFYLELAVIEALRGQTRLGLADNLWRYAFPYLRDTFAGARIVDPANTNNIISDDLTAAGKATIKAAATRALEAKTWNEIVL